MDKPLTVWYCDVCGDLITDYRRGYVIWQLTRDMKPYNFKIIHQSICDKRDFPASAALEDFLGPEGLAKLLSFLSLGPIMTMHRKKPHCGITDFDEFVDFFRRVQTPYYEEARRNFRDSDLLDQFSDTNEVGPYFPESLKEIIHTYGL